MRFGPGFVQSTLANHPQGEGMRGRYKDVRRRYEDALTQVSWQEFERLLAAFYAGQGYQVEHVGTAAAGTRYDGGIDLKLRRDDQYLVVQCKHWNVAQVPHNVVHELLGIMLTESATGAIVITSGEFTTAARAAAAKQPCVQLIDGAALREMLGPLATAPATVPVPSDADYFPSNDPLPAPDVPEWPRRPYRRHTVRPANPLPGLLVAVVALLIVFFIVRQVITGAAERAAARQAVSVKAMAPPPPARRSPPMPIRREVQVFAPASTPPPSPPVVRYEQTPMTDAELREWKRKNAEAMKIMEKTTPEMPLR